MLENSGGTVIQVYMYLRSCLHKTTCFSKKWPYFRSLTLLDFKNALFAFNGPVSAMKDPIFVLYLLQWAIFAFNGPVSVRVCINESWDMFIRTYYIYLEMRSNYIMIYFCVRCVNLKFGIPACRRIVRLS